ncbi:pimeloyl-CoA dehydrogenase large subunit [Siccirubricoccus deserti]|uniref:Acyl-CoA dehydrogenase family protein n=1 Tax=Siccirubricoccus deserti TaxID=2013562 RepID=A0A9X0QVL9_9PROT|nr:acyl-CoA dehydrogenase family protein [Siccirubricoccus deserti]MBC4014759.1 acyl-CoA dehydrogenase family protein [Siccirubricoccus deserti]GGC34728.1 pimeloyl-CoA dehydrogenase large subunit [Siccirubricoccus deserti]
MDLRYTPEEVAFRDEVRAFIRDNLPKDIRDRMRLGYPARKQDVVTWQRILNKRGWAAYSWPEEWGGPGWTSVQKMIFLEENLAAPAPEVSSFNITMLGPVLIQFGTEAQKRRYLPAAANLDEWWCQGFSEPGAGSDLASLKTRAVKEGDHYVINGQKIWTSTAHNADWCFVLVRTNPQAAKRQEGISFILVDMRTPGVEVRPIISIDGSHHLNEVFFTDVKVPVENLVGEENRGWSVAKYLLGNERTGIARLGRSKERVRFAKEVAREVRMNGKPLIEDRGFRTRVAQLEIDMKALEITQMRVVSAYDKSKDGRPDPLSSVLKIKGTELLQGTSELVMDVGGPQAMPAWTQELAALTNEPAVLPEWAPQMAPAYLMLRAASIYGGTNEIQKNILNKAVLGL